MKRKRYEDGGDVEMSAADYDDERPEESLQSRIAMAQAARKSSMRTAAQKTAPKTSSKPIDDQGREGRDRGPKPAMDQGREGRDRGMKFVEALGREGRDRGLKPPVDQGREGRDRGTSSYAKGGAVSASRRADGCAQRGKTRGKIV